MRFFEINYKSLELDKKIFEKVSQSTSLVIEGRIEEALRDFITLLNSSSNSTTEIIIYNLLGISFIENGRYDYAIACLEEALNIASKIEEMSMEAIILANIGTLFERESRWKLAQQYYLSCLKIFDKLEMISDAALVRRYLLELGSGGFDENTNTTEDEVILPKLSLTSSERLNRLGLLFIDFNELENAINAFDNAEKYAIENGDFHIIPSILNNKALAFRLGKQYKRAKTCYQQTIQFCDEKSDLKNLATTWNNLGLLLKEMGEYNDAIKAFNESLNIKEEMNEPQSQANTLYNLAKLYIDMKELHIARDFGMRALEIDEEYSQDRLEQDKNLLDEIESKIDN